MSEIVTERSGSILSIQFNRPDPHNVGVMLKFDVGSHLPKSWGFGGGD